MICLLLPVLGLRSSSAAGVLFEEKVAKALMSVFLSQKEYLVLPPSIFTFVLSVFSACREVMGLHAILASFLMNLQNSAKGGYPALIALLLLRTTKSHSSGSSSASHSSTTLFHLNTTWLGSFFTIL